jgi:hypothetical protein
MSEREPETAATIKLPATTAWPFIAAFAITLLLSGLVTYAAVSFAGLILLVRAVVGWSLEVLPEQREEAVPVSAETATAVSRSPAVRYLPGTAEHRVRIPAEVHPYGAGFYGGLAGAVAMALVAMLFGLIAQKSIWYPINLLAAGVLSSLSGATTEQLREFSMPGLIAGSLIHLTTSILVGLLYAVILPMFPRGSGWRAGLVTPVLWSGLIAATLDIINPTLNARIQWGWFVGSQMAFGIAAGWVVSRSEKIGTLQSRPLAERAGIEAQRRDDGL